MPLRWKGSATPPATFQVVEFKLDHPQLLIVGHDTSAHVVKDLHWIPSQTRTVPCLDEDCPWHHLPIREVIYAPCFYAVGSKWKIGIAPFTLKMRRFFEIDFAGKIFKFFRAERFNGPVCWAYLEHMRPCTMPVPNIDVRPSLMHMWGEYCNYKVPGPRLAEDLLGQMQAEQQMEGRAS